MVRLFSSRTRSRRRKRSRKLLLVPTIGSVLAEGMFTWQRTGRLGGNLVVRCSQGHLFTTIWIPAASLKSLRLGGRRFQYCPIGRHWTMVVPVREAELSHEQLHAARAQHDIRIP